MNHSDFNKRTFFLWTLPVTLLMATVICLPYDDLPSDAAQQAIAEQSQEIKELRAAVAMCGGENAVAESLGNGEYQCLTKRGHKTQIASTK